jgi:20S proteasome alpha/beta subunit
MLMSGVKSSVGGAGKGKSKHSLPFKQNYLKKKSKNRYRKKEWWRFPMTVCVAAICERTFSPKIIFSADRLVTSETEFELGLSKVQYITSNCLTMFAGDVLQGDRIVKNLLKRFENLPINEMNYPIDEIVNILSEEYKKILNENIETEILSPLGLTIQSFPDKVDNLPDWMSINIISQIQNYDIDVEFLIFGVEIIEDGSQVAHLYKVSGKGTIECFDHIGFVAIGSGSSLARSEMTKYFQGPDSTMSETVYRVYVAKRAAERVPGVGAITDFGVLHMIEDMETKEMKPNTWDGGRNQQFIDLLNNAYHTQSITEDKILKETIKRIYETFTQQPPKEEEKPKKSKKKKKPKKSKK